jgi:hypothetical protein
MSSDKQYFPVPLAHLTSPIAPALEPDLPPVTEGAVAEPPREPYGMLDVEELPEDLGAAEATLLWRDPYSIFAHWEATPEGKEIGSGTVVVRLSAASAPGAPPTQLFDENLARDSGRGYLPAPYPGALIDGALGLRGKDGGFTPIAFAPRVRVPWASAEDGPVEWMEVTPPKTRGLRFEPPAPAARGTADNMPGAAQRALPGAAAAAIAPTSPTVTSPPPSSPARGGR